MNKFLVILVVIAFSGCDRGSDSTQTDVSAAAGFWSGSIMTSTGETDIGGIIASNGKVAFALAKESDDYIPYASLYGAVA